jgi:hypothetical protein
MNAHACWNFFHPPGRAFFLGLALLLAPGALADAATTTPTAAGAATNRLAASHRVQTPRPQPPLTTGDKRRAGFLAGAGLVILTVLVLATGLALARTLKK